MSVVLGIDASTTATKAILVDEAGVIIAGHGRLLAAQKNGFAKYPVVIAEGWSEEKTIMRFWIIHFIFVVFGFWLALH